MHELTLAHSLLRLAEQSLAGQSGAVVTRLQVQAGELSGVDLDALRFAFEIIQKDTILEKAGLDIEIIPGAAQCRQCHHEFHLAQFGQSCDYCGSYDIEVLSGRDLKLVRMELEEAMA